MALDDRVLRGSRELPRQDRRSDLDAPLLRTSCSAGRVVVVGGLINELTPESAREVAGALLFYAEEAERLAGTWVDWDFVSASENSAVASSRGWAVSADGQTWSHASGARAEKHGELWYPRRSGGDAGAGVPDAVVARWYALATVEQTKDATQGPKGQRLVLEAIYRIADIFEQDAVIGETLVEEGEPLGPAIGRRIRSLGQGIADVLVQNATVMRETVRPEAYK
jgi:uncharacterized protein YjeT (DUF2065 family)